MLTQLLSLFPRPKKVISGLLISILSSLTVSLSVQSAEEIYFVYDSIIQSSE